MTIVTSPDSWHHFACDACPTQARHIRFERKFGAQFDAAKDQLKTQGWSVRRMAGEWTHHCPGCATRLAPPDKKGALL